MLIEGRMHLINRHAVLSGNSGLGLEHESLATFFAHDANLPLPLRLANPNAPVEVARDAIQMFNQLRLLCTDARSDPMETGVMWRPIRL